MNQEETERLWKAMIKKPTAKCFAGLEICRFFNVDETIKHPCKIHQRFPAEFCRDRPSPESSTLENKKTVTSK